MKNYFLEYEEFKLYRKYFKDLQTSEEIDIKLDELKNDKTLDEGVFDTICTIAKKLKQAFVERKNKKRK